MVRDWYERGKAGYEPVFVRASYFSIDWKSKIGNSDMGSNFFVNTQADLKKGDIVIREDGIVYMIDWKVQRKVNVQNTQAKDCNVRMAVYRQIPSETDDLGFVISEGGNVCVVPEIPCIWTPHSSRPEYTVVYNTPGLNPDNLFVGWVQWNETTKNIKVGDTFVWGEDTLVIVGKNIAEVDVDGEYGQINLAARKKPGGRVDGE